jgi:hypothetical protein
VIDPAERQRRFNRMTFDNRDAAAPHRRIVTDLILEACGDAASPRVCVLGAGNLNDVELAPLIARGARVVVTDLDGEGLRAGVARQGYADDPRVEVVPDVDVAPLLARLGSATREGRPLPEDEELRALAADTSAAALMPAGSEAFDVVVSTCLLSQLMLGLMDTLTPSHPRFLDCLLAVRNAHIRLTLDLCKTGGRVLLVTDVVSSDTVPGLGDRPREELPGLLAVLVAQRNFFSGMNPLALIGTLSSEPTLAPRIGELRVIPPWLWKMGPRDFLVCGFLFRRV